MQPRGPLMTEHRLIQRMIALMKTEAKKIEEQNTIYQSFINGTVDFLQTYADATHHGKEEKIFFRDLSKKKLSITDSLAMNELIEEHSKGRKMTAELVVSHDAYKNGNIEALHSLTRTLMEFVDFYPKHIKKEDEIFFPAAQHYLSAVEQKAILDEFNEFDRTMIHSKYKSLVDALER
jgi:hemerythrin-like domain-containing protein